MTASRRLLKPTMDPGFHLVLALAFEALWCAYRESLVFQCSFTTLFGMRLHSSPCVQRTAQSSLLLLFAARQSLFESFHLSWRWSIRRGTSASCWKCMWTRYLWGVGQRPTHTHAWTYCTICLHKTMSSHWRWYSCTNKHAWTGGGRYYHSISTDRQQY